MKLTNIGEFGLIGRLTENISYDRSRVIKGVGDDTAVLRAEDGRWVLFTTDMMVEGIHFSFNYCTARQVGKKALASNVSDIFAMGGLPTFAVVSIALPQDAAVDNVVEMYDGMKETAKVYNVNIVGGDTVKTPERLVVNVALLGEAEPGRVVYRSGARAGNSIFVTGPLGAAAAGLHLLQNPIPDCPPEAAGYCLKAHCEPAPNSSAGRILAGCGASAMEDVSDGLVSEMYQICGASGVGCRIRAADVPIDPRVRAVAGCAGIDPLEWALFGGEDYELVFTAQPQAEEEIRQALVSAGICIRRVGEINPPGEGMSLIMPDGRITALPRGGHDHFKVAPARQRL